jgi:hypothetical protein
MRHPPADRPLRWEQFFKTLYLRYEERYVLRSAPDLKGLTRRLVWSPESSAFKAEGLPVELDYEPRLSN